MPYYMESTGATSSGIDQLIASVAGLEDEIEKAEDTLKNEYPDAWEILQKIEDIKKTRDEVKDQIKEGLAQLKDFDLREVEGYNVKLSAIAKVKVTNLDEVDDEFKETKVVANEVKAKEYLKVMGHPPKGFEDNSYYRLGMKKEEGE